MNISGLMHSYFNEIGNNMINEEKQNNKGMTIPIVVSKSKWSVDDKIMSRIYEFDAIEKSIYFMKQAMEYIENVEHNIEVRFKREKCTVIIRALSPYITEYEQEAAKEFDLIYKDSNYLQLDIEEE